MIESYEKLDPVARERWVNLARNSQFDPEQLFSWLMGVLKQDKVWGWDAIAYTLGYSKTQVKRLERTDQIFKAIIRRTRPRKKQGGRPRIWAYESELKRYAKYHAGEIEVKELKERKN